ncbi:MAG TPA: response regulator [Xanthobacteraceae bacterium]|nr:response regulator [Xanthobacteraceae bacterium]
MSDRSARTAKILVVDDVAENRDLLLRRLGRLGFTAIDQGQNGHEALAAIAAKAYGMVLLDIMMPELDGFGVLEVLKRDGRINELPVIVISALSEIEPVVRCIEMGAEDYLFEPFNPTLLRARVLATLEKKALRDATRDELARKQRELEEARTLQLALAPPPFAGERGGRALRIDVLLEPAKEVGGDLVDHFALADDTVVLSLGDVSDKGAGAAYHRNGIGTVGRLEVLGGPPLGLDETLNYRAGEARLAPGDRLLIVTDGFTEAHDPHGALYGDGRVGEFMAAVAPGDTQALDRVAADVRAFAAGQPAFDDMAALLVTYGER